MVSESCVGYPQESGEALTGVRIGPAIELRNHLTSDCRPCDLVGKAKQYVALSQVANWIRGVIELVHVRKLSARKLGDPKCDQLRNTAGPIGEG